MLSENTYDHRDDRNTNPLIDLMGKYGFDRTGTYQRALSDGNSRGAGLLFHRFGHSSAGFLINHLVLYIRYYISTYAVV